MTSFARLPPLVIQPIGFVAATGSVGRGGPLRPAPFRGLPWLPLAREALDYARASRS